MARIYQRGNRFYIALAGNIRKSLGPSIKSREEAEAVLKKIQRKELDKKLEKLDKSRINLVDFKDIYIKKRETLGLSDDTLRNDKIALESLISVLTEEFPLAKINNNNIGIWRKKLLDRGVSPISINTYLRHIRRSLEIASSSNYIEKCPKLDKVKVPKPLPKHLNYEQQDKLLQFETKEDRKKLWKFLILTGLRRNEVVHAKYSHIIYIQGDPYLRIVKGKAKKERDIPLLPEAMELIAPLREEGLSTVF